MKRLNKGEKLAKTPPTVKLQPRSFNDFAIMSRRSDAFLASNRESTERRNVYIRKCFSEDE